MSEDPPKVRLRPRLAPEPAPPLALTNIPPAALPPAAPAAAATPAVPSLRLKPRLPGEPGSKPPMTGSGSPPPFASPPSNIPPPSAPVPATPPPAVLPAGSRAPVAGGSKAPILPPDVVPALVDSSAPMDAEARTRELLPLDERVRQVRYAATAIALAGVTAFATVAYVAYPKLTAQEAEFQEAQRLARLYAADDPAPEPAPAPSLPAPDSETPAPRPKPAAPPPAVESTPAPAAAGPSGPLEIPAVIGVENVQTATGAEGSRSFKEWVANVKITGLRTGPHPRILIGGSSYDVGDTVSIEHEIRFEGYDADRRVVRFKDASGAVLERRHP